MWCLGGKHLCQSTSGLASHGVPPRVTCLSRFLCAPTHDPNPVTDARGEAMPPWPRIQSSGILRVPSSQCACHGWGLQRNKSSHLFPLAAAGQRPSRITTGLSVWLMCFGPARFLEMGLKQTEFSPMHKFRVPLSSLDCCRRVCLCTLL